MEIKSISGRIFKTASSEKIAGNTNQTNPFGVSFKGNVIHADVFEASSKSNMINNLAEKVSNRGKMIVSAIVGSITDVASEISTRLNTRMESVRSFGRTIGEKAGRVWNYLNNHNLAVTIKTVQRNPKEFLRITIGNEYDIKNLMKLDPEERLEGMFKSLADESIMEAAV